MYARATAMAGQPLTRRLTKGWRGVSLGPPLTPRQPDAVSCGVYMLVGMWCCMSGTALSRLNDCSVNYWRNAVTLCLYRGGLGLLHVDM